MKTPDVSVVMSVYNGADKLARTIDSVCAQWGVDLEFIIVNDGSSDRSAEILTRYAARDSRIRLIFQENVGLTRALIRGCQEATAPFIARQDAGDISLPGRLKAELDLIRAHPSLVMVCCGTRFVLADGEPLYEVTQSGEELAAGLRASVVKELRGPSCHPATMFRTGAYRHAGGYRPEFGICQDIDLWVRLSETGAVSATREVLYEAEYALDGISPGKLGWQRRVVALILKSAKRRRMGESDDDILKHAEIVTRQARRAKPRTSEALYFIGSVLLSRNPTLAQRYLRLSLKENPLRIRCWIKIIKAWINENLSRLLRDIPQP